MSEIFTKEFPYAMDVAWAALHKTSYLDVDAGSVIERVSDDEWYSHFATDVTPEQIERDKTHCTTTYDESTHTATVVSLSANKSGADNIHLSLTEVDGGVSLSVDVEISTGVNVVSKLLMHVLGKHMKKILCDGIFKNFDALCSGKETHRRTKDEITDASQKLVKETLDEKTEN